MERCPANQDEYPATGRAPPAKGSDQPAKQRRWTAGQSKHAPWRPNQKKQSKQRPQPHPCQDQPAEQDDHGRLVSEERGGACRSERHYHLFQYFETHTLQRFINGYFLTPILKCSRGVKQIIKDSES